MLRMVVLPATFGPTTEKTWPCATSRLTRVTAWTPPKAFETSRISSCALIWAAPPSEVSCEPPLAAAVVLDVAVALSLPDPREAEIELLDVLVLADRLRVALQHDPPVLHHVAVLRDLERHRRVLLGEQHGDILRAEVPRDGLERAGLAGAVGPEEGHDAPLGYPERDPLQHEDDVIVDHLDVADRQERPGPVRGAHPATSPSRSRAPCTRASCPPRSPPPRSSGGRPHAWARSSPRRGSTSCRPTAGRGSGRSPRGPRR